MKAIVRHLHSPDVDHLETFQPERPDCFGVLIQMMVGPADGPGEEAFDVVVCTPRWLAEEVRTRGPLMGRHHIVVNEYDFPTLRAFLTNAIETEEAPTWTDLGVRIGRIGRWEFEDYQP